MAAIGAGYFIRTKVLRNYFNKSTKSLVATKVLSEPVTIYVGAKYMDKNNEYTYSGLIIEDHEDVFTEDTAYIRHIDIEASYSPSQIRDAAKDYEEMRKERYNRMASIGERFSQLMPVEAYIDVQHDADHPDCPPEASEEDLAKRKFLQYMRKYLDEM